MKIKLLALCISFNAFSETIDYKYIFSLSPKTQQNYKVVAQNDDIEIEQPITPLCGSSNQVDIELKPTENLCTHGTPSAVVTLNDSYTWSCEIGEDTDSCSANKIINTAKNSSCKAILEEYPQFAGQDGVYPATVGGLSTNLYCNMTDQGGGWTLVFAQFESDVASWNEGIQFDYNPSLSTNKAFAFNNSQIPTHTQISFSHSNYENKKITNVFNYIYQEGNINRTVINDILTGINYHIHRDNNSYYDFHNPDAGQNPTGNVFEWKNTFTIDRVSGSFFSFAFSANQNTNFARGYSYKGDKRLQNDSGAWLLYVR